MAMSNGLEAVQPPDQFGRYAIILLALAGIAGVFLAHVVAQMVFSLLFAGGVSLVLFSLVARPLGSPQRETWLAALIACGLLSFIVGTIGWPSPF
ncbi:MAG TPA: hypothetical protein VL026_08825 [Rhizomicrobium sp.]|nr:hypothetical protein [Rhizomicrobium sp.]